MKKMEKNKTKGNTDFLVREVRYCEMCGREMGIMSLKAYEAGHKHCDFCFCIECEEEEKYR